MQASATTADGVFWQLFIL